MADNKEANMCINRGAPQKKNCCICVGMRIKFFQWKMEFFGEDMRREKTSNYNKNIVKKKIDFMAKVFLCH